MATASMKVVLLFWALSGNHVLHRFWPVEAFFVHPSCIISKRSTLGFTSSSSRPIEFSKRKSRQFFPMASTVNEHDQNNNVNQSDPNSEETSNTMTDDELLQTVTKSQLSELCQQFNLSTKGTKMELLLRLRKHAGDQAAREEQRRHDLKRRIEQGGNEDSRERHEIVGNENYFESETEEDEEEEGYFYFELPTDSSSSNTTTKATTKQKPKKKQPQQKPAFITQSDVLAPPPPPDKDVTINEDGERVVTVYSTTDHNDLTGITAAQPGQAAMSGSNDPMVAGSSPSTNNQPQPWDMEHGTQQTKQATSKELDQAKEKVTELVQTLLAMSGAPAFCHFDMSDGLEDLIHHENDSQASYTSSAGAVSADYHNNGHASQHGAFVGFDPSKVPTHVLTEASQSLRANRGQVLQDVLREFEIHAVGQDGMAGDNLEDGGGHFREVAKVRAFLEGYRRAEVRKAARLTVTFLLDKLVSEGIEGLDLSLATMSRSSDDSASELDAYELNDSLIDYLNDVIREQEKKLEQMGNTNDKDTGMESESLQETNAENEDDLVSSLWNQTTGENGETIESLDPNDPKVQKVLREEYEKAEASQGNDALSNGMKKSIPESAPEKLLLLLTLLRERIKTEAAFANDERSRNLRLLAYCLQCSSQADRETLIMKDLGSSIDRLDSFLELLASSIEYAESTSYQLQPAKRMPLNVKLLKSILDLTEDIREQQAWKASGLRP